MKKEETIKEAVEQFKEQLVPFELRVKTIRDAISVLQSVCEHPDRECQGSGHTVDKYRCPHCQKEWWE